MKTRKNGAVGTSEANALPMGVIAKDLEWPSYKSKDRLASDVGDHGAITLYEVKGYGWVIVTLLIGSRGLVASTNRYYGIRVADGAHVRVGKGPHVTRVIQIKVRESRRKALDKFVQLY